MLPINGNIHTFLVIGKNEIVLEVWEDYLWCSTYSFSWSILPTEIALKRILIRMEQRR